MKSTTIADDAGLETRVVILDSGEEAFATLTKFANEAAMTAASLTAIGAFERATIGWFDFEKKSYKKIEVAEQCEVLSAIGDVAVGDEIDAGRIAAVVGGGAPETDRPTCRSIWSAVRLVPAYRANKSRCADGGAG